MSPLPNFGLLNIPDLKLVGYLLALSHEDGRGKALFFLHRGFRAEDPDPLRRALQRHASENRVVAAVPSIFGTRYRVEGPLRCPDGSAPQIRVIWFVRRGEQIPRLVTAYPIKPPG